MTWLKKKWLWLVGLIVPLAFAASIPLLPLGKAERNVENPHLEARKYLKTIDGKVSYTVPEDAPHNVKLYLFFNYKKSGLATGEIIK